MAINCGAHPQAVLAKTNPPAMASAQMAPAPVFEDAPPGTHSRFRPCPGTWPLPCPQGLTFTAFLSFFKKKLIGDLYS